MTFESKYFDLCANIFSRGVRKDNRTGVPCYTIPSAYISHNMSDGFPLLTSRFIPYKSVRVELEFFIKGLTDKKFLQENGCKYWDDWCNPKKVKYDHSPETLQKMREETDLGKIYGYQWRNFNSSGVDQFRNIVNTIKTNPNDRRMLCLAWNPLQLNEMALPPCHFGFQVIVIDDTLNLSWFQRSTDVILGLPSNFASYGTLLHLLCKESGLKEGELSCHINDAHIYVNHIKGYFDMCNGASHPLPRIQTNKFTSIFDWSYLDTELVDYKYSQKITFPIAV